ncbi:MAG: hypothetical protein HC933_17010 [Pleurocapsa sp. SU_196_0]|nr:hypothetical protein [Pleurocapsa sp. SU_196_0]
MTLLRQARGEAEFFKVSVFRAQIDSFAEFDTEAEASVQVWVGDAREHAAALGDGPVNALDKALRIALERHYPSLQEVELLDYKMRVLEVRMGTAARGGQGTDHLRDGKEQWTTVGAGVNSIKASFIALCDGLSFKLARDGVKPLMLEAADVGVSPV